MAFALYTQYVGRLTPCNMCLLQRAAVMLLGGVFLVSWVHHPKAFGARVYALLIALAAGAGAALAGRQVWMQAQPFGSLPSCGADLYTLLDMMSVPEAVMLVWRGGGDCQAITWSLFGLSMAAWVLVSVSLLGLVGIGANLLPRSARR